MAMETAANAPTFVSFDTFIIIFFFFSSLNPKL